MVILSLVTDCPPAVGSQVLSWMPLLKTSRWITRRSFTETSRLCSCCPWCKCTSKVDIRCRGIYNFCETLLIFEDTEARDRMRNKRDIEILTNAYFLALNHAERLISVELSINKNITCNYLWKQGSHNAGLSQKEIQCIWHTNGRAIVSNSSCLGNMENVLHFMNDTDCEDFFKMNMDEYLTWFHQQLFKNNKRRFCII